MSSTSPQPSYSTPKTRARIENEIERNREEGNWQRCLDLAHQLHSDNPQLAQFIMGEAKLEKHLETSRKVSRGYISGSGNRDRDAAGSEDLRDAKHNLFNCLTSGSALAMDASLLLAKYYFVVGDYKSALKYINDSGIDAVSKQEKQLSLRVMKIVAESFAVKGICLERVKGSSHTTTSSAEEFEDRVRSLVLASNLAIRYLQNIEKQSGPYIVVHLGSILELAVQRAPIVFIQSGRVNDAVRQFRLILNATETPSTMSMRQVTSRQLAELILRGIGTSSWPTIDLPLSHSGATAYWKPIKYVGQSLFVPREKEEELLLLLFISEVLAARNVVLDRSAEFHESRIQSLHNVIAVYDLLTIATIPIGYFALEVFERALKFSFDMKHVWMQYGLTLMEAGKSPERAILMFQEVMRIDPSDPLPAMFAAKVYLLDLKDAKKALKLVQEALRRCARNKLRSKIYIYLGVCHAMIYEEETESKKRLKKSHLNKSMKYFRLALKESPSSHLPYFHLALHMAIQRAIPEAIGYAKSALALSPFHLPTVELLILLMSSCKRYGDALQLTEMALTDYPDDLSLLFIKCHLELAVDPHAGNPADGAGPEGREMALLTARNLLRCCRVRVTEELENRPLRHHSSGGGTTVGLPSMAGQIAHISAAGNYDSVSLKMEQTLSEVASFAGDGDSTSISPRSIDIYSPNSGTLTNISLWAFQIQIWILITELYIKLGQLTEAESCINEGLGSIINGHLSHQLMYVKGLLCKSRGNLVQAKNSLLNAVTINPKHTKALQQLGHIYHLLGNQPAADKYLRDSLNVDSTLHETWSFIAAVLEASGDPAAAASCSLTAIQLEATAPILPFNIIARNILD